MKTISLIRKSVSNFPKTALLTGVGMAMSLFSSAQMSGSYTIDQGTAASSTNFQNFTSAVQALKGQTRSDGGPALGTGVNGAVTITVASGSGPYTEQVSLSPVNGASSSNTITFNGNGEWMTSSGSAGYMIDLNGADYIQIENLKIKPTHNNYSMAIWLHNSADHNVIKNCEMDMTTATNSYVPAIGFTTYYSGISNGVTGSFNLIEGNKIYGSSSAYNLRYGIYLGSSNSNPNTDNVIRGNEITDAKEMAIYAFYESDLLIQGNVLNHSNSSNSYYYYRGIYNYGNGKVTIDGNEINYASNSSSSSYYYYSYFIGIQSYNYYNTSNAHTLITNNIISGTSTNNSEGYMYGILSSNYYGDNNILHNTIHLRFTGTNNSYYYGYQQIYGIYAYSYYNSNNNITTRVLNNIIDCDIESQNNYYYYSYIYNLYVNTYGTFVSDGNVIVDNSSNNYYNTVYTAYYYNYSSSQTKYGYSLGDWQNASGLDANSSDADPAYVSVANGDFTPTASAIEGIGVNTSVSTDINGTTRSSAAPDPGAIEFTGSSSSAVASAKDTTLYLNANGTASVTPAEMDNGSTYSGSATFGLSKTSFDCSNVGANQVVFSVNAGSQTAYDTVTVTVVDALAPVVNTQNITVTLANGVASITANDVNNGSSDNCGISSMSVTPNNWTCNDIGNHTVTLTVNDANGNSASGTATVTVSGAVPSASISATPSNNTYTGAASNQMYIGYGAQSMNLTCSANGGSGFSYSWSGSYLSSSTGSTNVFTPTASGNYTLYCTVTNANGCETTSSITICVMDIRSNNNANNQKVYLCHNGNTLSISVNAVGSHLNNHSNDKLGQCSWSCNSLKKEAAGEMFVSGDLELIVYPNPSNGVFKFTLESESDESIDIRIYDAAGKLVLSKTGGYSHEEIHVDASALASGIYTAVVSQGDFIQTVKLTKTN